MGEFIESKNKVIIKVDEEYWWNGGIIPEDDLVVGAIKYLRKMGKSSDFLGFDVLKVATALSWLKP